MDFEAVAYDAVELHEALDIVVGHYCNFMRVEVVECFAVSVTTAQYCEPRKSSLSAFENEVFKESVVVGGGLPPFVVVVGDVVAVGGTPGATSVDYVGGVHFENFGVWIRGNVNLNRSV